MAYQSLFRTYRPQTFADVVGQAHVTTTLQNALKSGRVASGYLFAGTRGTAKTTCARILAKALNCVGPDGKRTAPTSDPCGVCEPCQRIAASNFVDVLEMDAASHGKIDDARDLVASVKFPPMQGRFKVYIVDEAHQLSRDAMDALLKTLEEPPPYVTFVLATTEADKLPITIASRCQVFEFKRGSVSQISERLRDVLTAEHVNMDAAAVLQIARAADGSYRDSLSLLEQVLAFKRDHITARDVALVLGAVDEDVLDRAVLLLADSDAAGVLSLTADVLEAGRDVRSFLKSLSGRLRDLLYLGVGATPEGGTDDTLAGLREQAARFSPAALLDALQVLTEAESDARRSPQARLVLEMALLRIARLPTAPTLDIPPRAAAPALDVPLPVKNGAHAPVVPKQAPAPEQEKPPSLPSRSVGETPSLPSPSEGKNKDTPAPPPFRGEGDGGWGLLSVDETALPDEDDAPLSDLADDEDIADDDTPYPGADEDSEPVESRIVTSAEPVDSDLTNDYEPDFMQVQTVAAPIAPAAADALDAHAHRHAPPSDTDPPELTQLQRSWQEVINRMSNKPSTLALIKDARPVAFVGHTFTLEFTQRVWVDKLGATERGRQMVEDAICRTLKAEVGTYKVKGVLQGEGLNGTAFPAQSTPKLTPAPAPAEQPSPLFDEVIALFGGRVIDES